MEPEGTRLGMSAHAEYVDLVNTITKLVDANRGRVIVTGSHGGAFSGYCAAVAGVAALISNDAGIGRDQAGIGSLGYLEDAGIAAATADSLTCRIGDAADMLESGRISHVNASAAALGCETGMSVAQCAARMAFAVSRSACIVELGEVREVIVAIDGEDVVIAIDSASLIRPSDAGRIMITGSHGGLIEGKPGAFRDVEAFAAIFNDAGGCKDGSGFTRLGWFAERGVPAATVGHWSARIGDGRSTYADGTVSRLNGPMSELGGKVGMTMRRLTELLIEAWRKDRLRRTAAAD